jgi:hypothetical protein
VLLYGDVVMVGRLETIDAVRTCLPCLCLFDLLFCTLPLLVSQALWLVFLQCYVEYSISRGRKKNRLLDVLTPCTVKAAFAAMLFKDPHRRKGFPELWMDGEDFETWQDFYNKSKHLLVAPWSSTLE